MAYTLLQIVAQASGELGLAVPTTVISNSTPDVLQMLYLTNGLGLKLMRRNEWQKLTTEYRFTTVYYQYTATTTNGSTTISSLSSTTGLTTTPTYFMVTGTGINQDTYLSSVNVGNSTAVLTQAATADGTAVTLTFSQTKYAFPTDFDRLISRTDWDKSKHWEMLGPETAQQWQWLKSGYISTGPRIRYRQLGSLFQIWPPISVNDYLGFEYLSNYWVTATGGSTPTKSSFTVDTDTCSFSDRLMTVGLKYEYYKAKGFDVGEETQPGSLAYDFKHEFALEISNDTPQKTLSMAPRMSTVLIGWDQIPDSSYGS